MMPKVICCTMYSPSYEGMADICLASMNRYAARHGYSVRHIQVNDNDAWFKKHDSFERFFDELGEGDVIWYTDCDSLVMNHKKPITDFLFDTKSFFITKDFTELNGGSVIIRNDEIGREINRTVLAFKNSFPNEQNYFNSQSFKDSFGEYVMVLPQHAINSYKYSLYPECASYVGKHELGDYEPGDLLIHFPGLGTDTKLKLMQEYSKQIIE